jgi:tripartite-type tricarboxylate transporter receptor subunit TctC
LPTVAQGGLPGFAIPESWLGILGPAGLPRAVVMRFNEASSKAIADPEVKARIEGLGYEVTGSTPEQFQKQIDKTVDIYRRIVTTAGIKPE